MEEEEKKHREKETKYFFYEYKIFYSSQIKLLTASKAMEDFQWLNGGQANKGRPLHEADPVRWTSPPVNMIKINWDATLDHQKQVVGLGIFARDEEGHFLSAWLEEENVGDACCCRSFSCPTRCDLC